MASRTLSTVFGRSGKSKVPDQSLLTCLLAVYDDDKFCKDMVDTHAPDEGEVDVQSLFALAHNTLNGTTAIVDNVLNTKAPRAAPAYNAPKDGFTPLLSAISEVTCQLHFFVGIIITKAVITLSSFALCYGDYWRLARVEKSDRVTESKAILKGLPAITKPQDQQKNQVFGVLNDMIKSILEITECIVVFENESKDVPELAKAIDIAGSVYQIIVAILATSIQFTSLISVTVIDESKERSSF